MVLIERRSRRAGGAFTVAMAILAWAAAMSDARAFAGYREETLDNGLRVILIEHRANPMIAASVVVRAGVVHEPEGLNGGSHLLEHLLFNGTTTRTQKQLYDDVDRMGAYNNATTREDHTLFSLLVQKEFVDRGLEIQADMLFRSTIPPENFEKEKGIVLEEMARDEADPGYRAGLEFRRVAFAGTPLARPVLGTRESIAAVRRDDVWAYYKSRYVPSNMTLVVMGDFASNEMLPLVRKHFGSAPSQPSPARAPAAWTRPATENLVTGPLEAERVYLNAAFPLKLAPHDPLMPAVELVLDAIAGTDDAPVRRDLVSGADPATLSFSLAAVAREEPWSTVEVEAAIAKGKPFLPVLDRVARGLRDLGRGSTARGRIEAVRARALAEDLLSSDQIHYYALTRSPYVAGSPRGYLDRSALRYRDVSEDQLDAAARLLAEGLTDARVSVLGPDIAASRVAWQPAPAKAQAAARAEVVETLASGLQVVLERNDDSQVFALHLMVRPRSAAEPRGKEGIASFLHRLMARGTLVQDAGALAARLDALGANLKTDDDPRVPYDDYYTTPDYAFVRFEMPASRWREGVALLGEIVRFPRFDDASIEAVRQEILDLQKRRAESTRNRAVELMDRTLAPGHPAIRPVLGTPESVTSITRDDLLAFHRDHASGRRMILTGVSPIDPAEVLEAVRGAFGDLPQGPDLPPAAVVPVTTGPAEAREPARGGPGSSTIVIASVFDAPKEDAAALAALGAILSDRLTFRLREELGLAYSMGASIQPWGGRTRFQIVMGTRRENIDQALKGLRDGITGFSAPDAAEVEKTVAAMRGRLLMRRLTRVNQAYYLGLERLDGRPPRDDLERLQALLRVTPEKVSEVFGKYVDPKKCVTVIVE